MSRQLLDAARHTLRDCMGVKAREKVTVVADDWTVDVAEALVFASREANAETVLVLMSPRGHNGEEPPAAVAAAMRDCDVCLLATKVSLSHTIARKEANAAGVRAASMPGINADILIRTMAVDYAALAGRTRDVAAGVTGAPSYRLTAANGTDMTINVAGRVFGADVGIYHEPGTFGNLPAGEVCTGPVLQGSSGVAVFDGSFAGIGLLREPVMVRFRDGVAEGVEGGAEAAALRRMIATYGDGARVLAELGIGTHPTARLTGVVLEDEKISGTVHLALGNNLGFGGTNDVKLHVDGVIMKPTLTSATGLAVVEDGVLRL